MRRHAYATGCLAIDAGGPMTDAFHRRQAGRFIVGKAQTTPDDEAPCDCNSGRRALRQWDSYPRGP